MYICECGYTHICLYVYVMQCTYILVLLPRDEEVEIATQKFHGGSAGQRRKCWEKEDF